MDPVLTPMLISAGVTASFSIGASTVTLASIISYTILTAAVIGGSVLAQRLGQDDKGKHNTEQFTVKEAIGARRRGYGTTKLGGNLVFLQDRTGTLFSAIVHCEGPIDSYREWWLNDKVTAIAAGSLGGQAGVVPWTIYVVVESHLGADDQVASTGLLTNFPGTWTSNHRLRGLAYSVMGCQVPVNPERNLKIVFPNGAPQLRVVARLAKVYDPRLAPVHDIDDPDTWAWSDNVSLCILDFLKSPRGFGLSSERMNLDSFAVFADLCDEAVPLKAGGTEKRYRLGGVYDLTEEPRDVLRRMLSTCDGEIVPLPDGTVGIRGGEWVAPTVTISDAQVLAYEYQAGGDKLAAFNKLKITYTSPGHDYQQIEGEAWEDEENQDLTGEVRSQDLPLPMVQSHAQARRLAKIVMAKGNPVHRLSNLTAQLPALDLLGERAVHITLADLGIDADFLITRFVPADDLSTVTLDAVSLDASAYSWNAALEEGTAASTPGSYTPATPPTPDNLDLSLDRTLIGSNVNAVRIKATVDAPTDTQWQLHAQYRLQGATDWLDMEVDETDPWAAFSDVVNDGSTYEVQAALRGFGGSDGTFTAIESIPIISDPTAPGVPTGVTAGAVGSDITVAWTNPNSANYYATRVYRNASNTFGTATLIQTVLGVQAGTGSYLDASRPSGTYWYWTTAINPSAAASASVSSTPSSVTIP